ncbi:MAG: hypothetical protein IPP19_01465 [Verrucomicrobia bacterium]|nr:hypothetical protein [Verrucomicrobiota bacterium]
MYTRLLQTPAPRIFLFAAAIFSFTGCSDQPPKPNLRAEQMAAANAKPAMLAQDSYFDGKLLVEASLGQGFGARGEHGGVPGDGYHGGVHHGGGMRGGPGGGPGGDMGGPGGEEMAGGRNSHLTLQASSLPPVALRLRLTNQSKENIVVTFVLCKSELGDFAVRPEKLTLAPGETIEPDPMRSSMGLTTSELVLEVSLRMAGVVEKKNLILKPVAPEKTSSIAKP